MDWNSKEFKELQKKWDKKLKDSGFEDIETNRDYEYIISSPISKKYITLSKDESYMERIEYYNSVAEYYRLAGEFLHTHKFSKELHKDIWEMHSEGKSYRDISKFYKEYKNVRITKDSINKVIQDLRDLMFKEHVK